MSASRSGGWRLQRLKPERLANDGLRPGELGGLAGDGGRVRRRPYAVAVPSRYIDSGQRFADRAGSQRFADREIGVSVRVLLTGVGQSIADRVFISTRPLAPRGPRSRALWSLAALAMAAIRSALSMVLIFSIRWSVALCFLN